MNKILIILFLIFTFESFGQGTIIPDDNSIVDPVSEMPVFPGGEPAFFKWLTDFSYSIKADSTCIPTKIFISFSVDTTGKVINPDFNFRNVIPLDCTIDETYREKLESDFAEKMPPWSPGKQNNKKAIVRLTVPLLIDWQ